MEPLAFAHLTDVGRVRKVNQDSLAVFSREQLNGLADALFVVADGMGGRAGGEIASRVTVETVPKVVKEVLVEEKNVESPDRMREAIHEALLSANEAVFGQAKANPELRGMGTTCVAVLITGDLAVVGNVGDSRVYLLREGGIRPLTHDHSLVAQHVLAGELTEEEARASRYRNVITRAVGIADAVEPDVELIRLQSGDTLLLCSDGLTNMLKDNEIARILARGEDPEATCGGLIAAANAAGGADNISVVVARYGRFLPVEIEDRLDPEPEAYSIPTTSASAPRRSIWRYLQLPLLFAVVAGAWFLLSRYELDLKPPYLKLRKPDVPAAPAPVVPKKVDFTNLTYTEAPQNVSKLAVKSTILAITPSGTPLVVKAKTGGILLPAGPTQDYGRLHIPETQMVATDPDGNLYYYDARERAIVKYNRKGTRTDFIGKNKLTNPGAIAVDNKGNVYVIENGKLKVFKAARAGSPENRDAPR